MKMQFRKRVRALVLSVALMISVLVPISSSASAASETRQNDYPIVLCHGCNGWGRAESFGTVAYGTEYYWGGNEDLQQDLTDLGYTTYTAAVGPLSSNWDRACELYAEIKGGTVDYGAAHSALYGHARYGRTYSGFFPQWGTTDASGNTYKIHLIGHSQGGQTVRLLSELLGEGSAEERAASGSSVSPLFMGNKDWIDSVTTLASPHDGTTLADVSGTNVVSAIALAEVGSTLGAIQGAEQIYDIKLDQFGLVRAPNESLAEFIQRVAASSMWTNSTDNCAYDLSTNGAVVMNEWVKAQPDTYYFSWACKGTKTDPLSLLGHQIADPTIMGDKGLYTAQWWLQAAFMGSYTRNDSSREIPLIDSSWWPNDGYVNTISENGPKYGSSDLIQNYNGTAIIGEWNFMGTLNIDHEDIIGRNWDDALRFFTNLAAMLGKLPK